MPVHDISAPLREDLPSWPGEEGLRRRLTAEQPKDPATVSHLALGAHTGTHVDAPVHFLPGAGGIETFSPDAFVGHAFVCDLRHVQSAITADDLTSCAIPDLARRILARTSNSGWSQADTGFREDYVAYDVSAAEWCVARGVALVGIDYLSIEPYDEEAEAFPVHETLLGAGIAILEGIDLAGVEPGLYTLAAPPLLVPGSDGAPARALLTSP